MRSDEKLCRQSVDQFLRERDLQPEWEKGGEPPDYFVVIRNQRIAVEVTSVHGETELGGKSCTWTGLSKDLLCVGEDVVREVKSRVDIPGTHYLWLPSMPKLREHQTQIVQALVAHFKKDAVQAAKMERTVVLRSEGRDVTVSKMRMGGSDLVVWAVPTGALMTYPDDQLRPLLKSAIQEKVRKLSAVAKPWWLVILDRYGFQRSMEEWCARLPAEATDFAAVLRVQNGRAQLVSGAC